MDHFLPFCCYRRSNVRYNVCCYFVTMLDVNVWLISDISSAIDTGLCRHVAQLISE